MTKATLKKQHLTGKLLTVLEVPFIITVAESAVAGMADVVLGRQRKTWGFLSLKAFEAQAHPSDTLPPTRPHLLILLILSKSSTPW